MCLTLDNLIKAASAAFNEVPDALCTMQLARLALTRLRQECALSGCGEGADLTTFTKRAVSGLAAQVARQRQLQRRQAA